METEKISVELRTHLDARLAYFRMLRVGNSVSKANKKINKGSLFKRIFG